jgi:ATP-dependent DNA helicase RecQ
MDAAQVLRDVFGFESFRPGQGEVVGELLEGRNVLAVMPTGSGKSLCFQVPALARDGMAIVVSPLVALMKDQVAALKLAGVAADTINSSQSRDENVAIWQRVSKGDIKILYLSPERLMTERMIAALQRFPISLFAVDEAHCMSQWGPAFRPEYDMLKTLRHSFADVPIGAFTATADEPTRRDILQKLFGGQARMFVSGFDRPNIKLSVSPKQNATKQLLEFLETRRGQSGIVYALSRKSTEEWTAELKAKGYRAVAYHAGLHADERAENQDLFMTEKGVIVCATIAFGMGIDKPDVRFVFHADLPSSIDAYYQELGRAGRDGQAADAHMVFGVSDIMMRRRFIDGEESDEERKRREHRRLDSLVAYAEAATCRRQSLLSYFGETADPCGNCDICMEPGHTHEGNEIAKLVLETCRLTGQRFGSAHLTTVMMGESNEKTGPLGHDQLEVFGLGKAHSRMQWLSILRQMIAGQFLKLDVAGHGGLSLGDRGHKLLRGEDSFRYRLAEAKPKRATKTTEATSLNQPDDQVLTRLKTLRLKLAKKRRVAAYVIFSDRSLIDMATKMPKTKIDFAEVHGVGKAKVDQFADVFLAEIAGA